jgi:hypothetical protein
MHPPPQIAQLLGGFVQREHDPGTTVVERGIVQLAYVSLDEPVDPGPRNAHGRLGADRRIRKFHDPTVSGQAPVASR